MKTYYKLTDKNSYTRKWEINETLWGENIRHDATGEGKELCSNGFIHAYESPEMAVFMNSMHGDYDPDTMLLWECHLHGEVKRDGQLKCGAKGCTTLRIIPLPVITTEQRITTAIKIALQVYEEDSFVEWANNWLSGKDRSSAAANAADAAAYAAHAAVNAAVNAAANAADTAYAAHAAVNAAVNAAHTADIDILSIIKEVIYSD